MTAEPAKVIKLFYCYAREDKAVKELLVPMKTKEEWLKQGKALKGFKRNEEALAAFEQAIRLDPNSAADYHGKGEVLERLNRNEEALATYEQDIRLDPDDAVAYNNKGNALERLRRKAES